MTAVGLINLGSDIFPTFVKWSEFFLFLMDKVRWIRDLVLLPIVYPMKELFNLVLLDWWKSYLFIGFLLFNTYNSSYAIICGHLSFSSPLRLFFGPERFKALGHIIFRILLWPLTLIGLLIHYFTKGYKKEHNVYTLWGKFVFYLVVTIVVLIFLNWTMNQI